jgi:hypothetical protein
MRIRWVEELGLKPDEGRDTRGIVHSVGRRNGPFAYAKCDRLVMIGPNEKGITGRCVICFPPHLDPKPEPTGEYLQNLPSMDIE